MRALRITEPGKFKIIRMPEPKPGPGEVVVRLEFAAICNQNDVKIFDGLYLPETITYPLEPGAYGHEGVGTVVELGESVGGLSTGDHVALCGKGGPMLYREYVQRKADSVVKISAGIPAAQAAPLELFACARHCLNVTGDIRGRRVAVSGLGPAGLAMIQLLRNAGAGTVLGIEPHETRRGLAAELGAAEVIDPGDEAAVKRLKDESLDTVIDTSGSPGSLRLAFDSAARQVVIFGFTDKKFDVDPVPWFRKELVIKNSALHTMDDLRAVVRLLESGRIKSEPLISGVFHFEDYDKAVEEIRGRRAIKVLLAWDEERTWL